MRNPFLANKRAALLVLITDVMQRIFFSTKGAIYISIGCQPNVSKSSRNKAPKVRHKSSDISHVAH